MTSGILSLSCFNILPISSTLALEDKAFTANGSIFHSPPRSQGPPASRAYQSLRPPWHTVKGLLALTILYAVVLIFLFHVLLFENTDHNLVISPCNMAPTTVLVTQQDLGKLLRGEKSHRNK